MRPRFDRWSLSLHIVVDTAQIDESRIREVFDMAGSRVGLGDFRPARKGIFGKFHVVSWVREDALAQAAE